MSLVEVLSVASFVNLGQRDFCMHFLSGDLGEFNPEILSAIQKVSEYLMFSAENRVTEFFKFVLFVDKILYVDTYIL